MEKMRINTKRIFILLNFIAPILIGLIGLYKVEKFLYLSYAILSISCSIVLGLTSRNLFINDSPKSQYLFALLLSLGTWLKFSIYKIMESDSFREPIGNFVLGSSAESNVLWVSSLGIVGIGASHLLTKDIYSKILLNKKKGLLVSRNASLNYAILIFLITLALSFINIKFNILLFSVKPDIQLPFSGNALLFLLITRGLPFLFIFYFWKSDRFLPILATGILISTSSIGVLSRMGILVFFFTVLLTIPRTWSKLFPKQTLNKLLPLTFILVICCVLNVSVATKIREVFFQNLKKEYLTRTDPDHKIVQPPPTNRIEVIIDLALSRWVGIEGIMALEAYEQKSMRLLQAGLLEESFRGSSLYSSLLNESNINTGSDRLVYTSVPGPIAFAYYSGSLLIVFGSIFILSTVFTFLELMLTFFAGTFDASVAFIISFIAIDLHQFGVSPLAFVKYTFVTVFSSLIFYILIGLKNRRYSNS